LAILEEVAPEVPVSLDTPDQLERMRTIIIQCHKSGESWVAVDAAGAVVGVVLAKLDLREKDKAFSLPYIGVSESSRNHGIFTALMGKLKAKGVPLTASVLHGNKSAMVDRLVEVGFTKGQADAKETKLRWDPAPLKSRSALPPPPNVGGGQSV
jgi:hypothetical protein